MGRALEMLVASLSEDVRNQCVVGSSIIKAEGGTGRVAMLSAEVLALKTVDVMSVLTSVTYRQNTLITVV